jgi:salicylate hydroxylase
MKRYLDLHPLRTDGVQWSKRFKSLSSDSKILFEDGSDSGEDAIDLIIGCDGINSSVRKLKYLNDTPLNYLGIMIVLGITKIDGHFLGQKRVFQSMDGNTRLFVMPYACENKNNQTDEIMWQMSFPLPEAEAQSLSKNLTSLKNYVFDKCGQWHPPIPQMIKSTVFENLMGIPAYDRDVDISFKEADHIAPVKALLGEREINFKRRL